AWWSGGVAARTGTAGRAGRGTAGGRRRPASRAWPPGLGAELVGVVAHGHRDLRIGRVLEVRDLLLLRRAAAPIADHREEQVGRVERLPEGREGGAARARVLHDDAVRPEAVVVARAGEE